MLWLISGRFRRLLFHPFEAAEVMNAQQAGQFLQVDEATVIELVEAGNLVAWLSVAHKK